MRINSTRFLFLALFFTFFTHAYGQSKPKDPSFEEIISLQSPSNPQISPDGKHVAFTVGSADWVKNRFDTEIWLSKNGKPAFQLTRNLDGNSTSPQWSPNGTWIAFLSNRGNKNQIFVINPDGGEAFPVTNEKEGVGGFEWSPDGNAFAFTKTQEESKKDKTRSERYGAYEVDDEEYKLSWLYFVKFDPGTGDPSGLPCYNDKDSTVQAWKCIQLPKAEALIDSVDFTINAFFWSPDGKKIAVTHAPDPLINSFFNADISILDVQSKKLEKLVTNPSSDNFVAWSPQSDQILYTSAENDRTSNYYKNSKLFKLDVATGAPQRLAREFDENLFNIWWTRRGIFALGNQRTQTHVFKVDPDNGKTTVFLNAPNQITGFSATPGGEHFVVVANDGNSLNEVLISPSGQSGLTQLTQFNAQIENWKVARSETIRWSSKDGASIEGVLHKPMDYNPSKKYPLLVVIHGGPTGVDRPTPVPAYVYPINQWLNKGALVLRVNYRGSAGYGEAFRSLNVRNLGVGDAWDVLSGVDYLDKQGLIDTTKMGAMGWSQGGYISAFLTTNTNRFKAISVGAGISNWMTYYVNTDIHPFTRQYLQATPWDDEGIYKKTSPMTNILNAKTPTLIQHGELDRRVPIANAYELVQGLRDVGVSSKLIVYKGFGHGITKPKERLAAVWHNWQWFGKYIWGEEVKMPDGLEE